jgi:hypothetical protein
VIVHCNVCEKDLAINKFPGSFTHGCDYGLYYNDDANCSWKLSDIYADTIYLSFDKFDIQHGDYLKIKNIYTNELIYSFNNDNDPKGQLLKIALNGINLELATNNDGKTGRGFLAAYGSNVNRITVNVSNRDALQQFNLYPNPTDGLVQIYYSGATDNQVSVTLISPMGNLLMKEQLKTQNGIINEQLDFSSMKNGIYYLIMIDKNIRYMKKVVIF